MLQRPPFTHNNSSVAEHNSIVDRNHLVGDNGDLDNLPDLLTELARR